MKKDIFVDLNEDQMQLLTTYAENNMYELRKLCKPLILHKHLAQMEEDELLDDALMVLAESVKTFDPSVKCSFRTYLTGNIQRSYMDWTRDRMRWKRCNLETDKDGNIKVDPHTKLPIPINNVSLDAPNEDGFDIGNMVACEIQDEMSEGMVRYLKSLTKNELMIANRIMEGYTISDLPELLHMSTKQVDRIISNMNGFEKRCLINYCDDDCKEEKVMENTTMEKSKSNKMSIASIKKKIENMTLRANHPLQRESEQWSNEKKGNLISDILQSNPIPALTFAEQIINGIAITWILDGKQRSITTACAFANDMFKVSKKVRRGIISYQAILKDEDDKILLDDNGFPKTEWRECDIRGKKFSGLPKELQEKFMDYNFEITQYLNCTSEDIAYHMARLNDGQPMNPQQKGIINLGEKFAMAVKGISAMPFFKEMGNYTARESKGTNGVLDRVVIESVMTNNFIDDWKKNQSEMCSFLKENATEEMFDNFEDLVDRLSVIADENTLEKFDSKNSFLWFGLFGRFVNLGEPDKRFIEFMAEFSRSLHSKKIDGESFDDLISNKSTKDKNVVIARIDKLTALMNEYLGIVPSQENTVENQMDDQSDVHIAKQESVDEVVKTDDTMDLVKSVNPNATSDDIEEYGEYVDSVVRISSPLYHQCHNALLAITAYVYQNNTDKEFAEWVDDYANTTYEFDQNQRVNFENMKLSFQEYLKTKAA